MAAILSNMDVGFVCNRKRLIYLMAWLTLRTWPSELIQLQSLAQLTK